VRLVYTPYGIPSMNVTLESGITACLGMIHKAEHPIEEGAAGDHDVVQRL